MKLETHHKMRPLQTEAGQKILFQMMEAGKAELKNLNANGDFGLGINNWKITGSAKITGGKAVLVSGRDTDSVMQKVTSKARENLYAVSRY